MRWVGSEEGAPRGGGLGLGGGEGAELPLDEEDVLPVLGGKTLQLLGPPSANMEYILRNPNNSTIVRTRQFGELYQFKFKNQIAE